MLSLSSFYTMTDEPPPRPVKKATFGDLVVSEAARERRCGKKLFDSADWAMGRDKQTQKPAEAPSTVLESMSQEEPQNSPLSTTDA